ncbi:MAG TPA: selenoneine synthase SenA [Burkholderiales bacterium]|nr:selenoneine synthase SenA [Burkholderiales bacterium]
MISLHPPAEMLRQMLLDARSRTLTLATDLQASQLLGPRMSIVNPPLWELGHLAWFQEHWCLRQEKGGTVHDTSIMLNADRLYDSAAVPHEVRWDLPLPRLEETLGYLQSVLERVLERVATELDADLAYFVQLAAFHEEMHCEALTYTRQTLEYSAPATAHRAQPEMSEERSSGDAQIAGGEFLLGADSHDGFVFDNEKWAHPVTLRPFRMARSATTNEQYRAFVEDQGYGRRDLWCTNGWQWRQSVAAEHPVYWRKQDGDWYARRYDVWEPIQPDEPVMHVNWFEANAYCRWAGRRLPSETEWEYAAATERTGAVTKRRYPWGDTPPRDVHANLFGVSGVCVDVAALPHGDSAWGCRQMIGNVWEWTADAFGPYPGFVADPYKEYSQPWFGDHKVLRGGSFATRAALIRNTWRNFYTPDRRDVFAGFRTCA